MTAIRKPSLEFHRTRAPKHSFFGVGDRLVWIDATGRYRIVLTKRIAGVDIPKPSRRYLILFDRLPWLGAGLPASPIVGGYDTLPAACQERGCGMNLAERYRPQT